MKSDARSVTEYCGAGHGLVAEQGETDLESASEEIVKVESIDSDLAASNEKPSKVILFSKAEFDMIRRLNEVTLLQQQSDGGQWVGL